MWLVNRSQIINHLIKIFNYKKYLEIGVHNPIKNFDFIKCNIKHGVDPEWVAKPAPPSGPADDFGLHSLDPRAKREIGMFTVTSDEFFENLDPIVKYDIIFIDGEHLEHQVTKDYYNSKKHLSSNGSIIFHDCNPPTAAHASDPENELYQEVKNWNGTCYRSYINIRLSNESIGKEMYVIDTDWGVGIIREGNQRCDYFKNHEEKMSHLNLEEMLLPGEEGFNNFAKHRKEALNLITPEKFVELFPKIQQ